MKAVIILRENAIISEKSLPRLWGLTLLERSLYTLRDAGVGDFLIVCGSHSDAVNEYIENKNLKRDFKLALFDSIGDIQMNNSQFLVVDSNVIFDERIIKNLITIANNNSIICVDSSPKYAEMDTVLSEGFVNVGIFLCNKKDIPILENIAHDTFISKDVVKDYGMKIYDVNGSFWYKVETQQNFKTAKDILWDKHRSNPDWVEGNLLITARRILSKFLLKWLVSTRLSPNQISIIGLSSFLVSAFLFSFGGHVYNIIGGIFILIGLSLDFSDGLVARLTFRTSKYGEWLEHIFDKIAINFIIFGATIGLYIQTGNILSWVLGIFLIISLSLSSFMNKTHKEVFNRDITSLVEELGNSRREIALKRFYNFCGFCARAFLWILIGAFLNIMLISFLVIIIGANLQMLMLFVLGIRYRRGINICQ